METPLAAAGCAPSAVPGAPVAVCPGRDLVGVAILTAASGIDDVRRRDLHADELAGVPDRAGGQLADTALAGATGVALPTDTTPTAALLVGAVPTALVRAGYRRLGLRLPTPRTDR